MTRIRTGEALALAEEWREIPGTLYSVSNEGRVASRHRGGRMLKGIRDPNGYMHVDLCDGSGGKKSARVHTLVAEAYLGPRPTPSHQINHVDGNKSNNRARNLEWATPSENQHHRFDVLKHVNVRGGAHFHAKVTEAEVRQIRTRRAAGETCEAIAVDYGINRRHVGKITNGKRWAWLA